MRQAWKKLKERYLGGQQEAQNGSVEKGSLSISIINIKNNLDQDLKKELLCISNQLSHTSVNK